jgi:hypothetical protein
MSLILPRRSLLAGLAALVAAPAIVRASSLMPVKALKTEWPPQHAFHALGIESTDELVEFLLHDHTGAVVARALAPVVDGQCSFSFPADLRPNSVYFIAGTIPCGEAMLRVAPK